jgi:uncharacterized paraquat-inducible protein A
MMKVLIIVLGMGMMVSPVVQAQQAGQGSAVPRQSIVVAQAGAFTSPGSPVVAAPVALPAAFVPVMVIMGLTVLTVGASSTDTSTNH